MKRRQIGCRDSGVILVAIPLPPCTRIVLKKYRNITIIIIIITIIVLNCFNNENREPSFRSLQEVASDRR